MGDNKTYHENTQQIIYTYGRYNYKIHFICLFTGIAFSFTLYII